jgi:hypothetical protein
MLSPFSNADTEALPPLHINRFGEVTTPQSIGIDQPTESDSCSSNVEFKLKSKLMSQLVAIAVVSSFTGIDSIHSLVKDTYVVFIPKGHNTGKWRLITDLSFPRGQSVNDGIEPDLCSICYISG